jgi:hypothetical protein
MSGPPAEGGHQAIERFSQAEFAGFDQFKAGGGA